MNKRNVVFILVSIVLLLALAACSFSASTANIKNARLSKDEAGTQTTTTFAPTDTTFYLVADLANAPDDTKAKAVWTAVQVQGAQPNSVIDSAEVTSGDGKLNFKLSNNGPWPVGKYKVDLLLNDKTVQTLNFEVK